MTVAADRGIRSRIPMLVAAAITFAIAGVGGAFTDLGDWYLNLEQPGWKPADELFPVIWTVIFALAGASAYLAWRGATDTRGRALVIGAFLLNGFLNILWSYIFFILQRPDWAMVETGFLWLSVLSLVLISGRYSTPAPWLVVPYLLWVTAAAVLNWQVIELNGPFM